MHYSLATEKGYLYCVRFFIRWSARNGQMQHPRQMGAPEVEAFLTMLATERKVSSSAQPAGDAFFKLAPTSARCKSCWATGMSLTRTKTCYLNHGRRPAEV